MNIIEILGVMAKGIESFYAKVSYLDTLYIAGIFMGLVTLLSFVHIVFGAKATTMRHARSIAKYFERYYIGSFLDARKFLKKRRWILSRKAKREFSAFINSTSNLASTDFAEYVMERGRHSLHMVLGAYSVAIAMTGAFLVLKAYLGGLSDMTFLLYVTLPIVGLMLVKFALYLLTEAVHKNYKKSEKRLWRAIAEVKYNNEYDFEYGKELEESVNFLSSEDDARKNAKADSMNENIGSSYNSEYVEDVLGPEDMEKYDILRTALNIEGNVEQ